jgi:hypothetical protein
MKQNEEFLQQIPEIYDINMKVDTAQFSSRPHTLFSSDTTVQNPLIVLPSG